MKTYVVYGIGLQSTPWILGVFKSKKSAQTQIAEHIDSVVTKRSTIDADPRGNRFYYEHDGDSCELYIEEHKIQK